MTKMTMSPGEWLYRGYASEVLALAALAFATDQCAEAGRDLLGYGIAIIEGPPIGLAGLLLRGGVGPDPSGCDETVKE